MVLQYCPFLANKQKRYKWDKQINRIHPACIFNIRFHTAIQLNNSWHQAGKQNRKNSAVMAFSHDWMIWMDLCWSRFELQHDGGEHMQRCRVCIKNLSLYIQKYSSLNSLVVSG